MMRVEINLIVHTSLFFLLIQSHTNLLRDLSQSAHLFFSIEVTNIIMYLKVTKSIPFLRG